MKRTTVHGIAPHGIATSNSGRKSSTSVLDANPDRLSWSISNQSTAPLTINFGFGSEILPACGVSGDGTGGRYFDDEFDGLITCSGSSIDYIVNEFA